MPGGCTCQRGTSQEKRPCEVCKRRQRLYNEKNRKKALKILGGKCARCPEEDVWKLTFDHIYNDGAAHRKEIYPGGRTCSRITGWIRNNPEEAKQRLQILCGSCHIEKDREGIRRLWDEWS